MSSTNAFRRSICALRGLPVLAVIVSLLPACDASSSRSSLERTCGRAFEQQVNFELRDVKDATLLHEQRRLLDSVRQESITACVESSDEATARCAADAQSLEALLACRNPRTSTTN
jgi:hypothetical protein